METNEGKSDRKGAPGRRRALLRWAISAAIGVAAALLVWWLLSPYVWFWEYEDALDSDDQTARGRANALPHARV